MNVELTDYAKDPYRSEGPWDSLGESFGQGIGGTLLD